MKDLGGLLKFAIIQHLCADTALTELVPESRIFGLSVPANVQWPFIRYGIPNTTGYEASCWSGSTTQVTIHAFAESNETGAGEDKVLEIAASITRTMMTLAPKNLAIIELDWTNTVLLKDDPEADRWHSVVTFNITAVEKD